MIKRPKEIKKDLYNKKKDIQFKTFKKFDEQVI